MVATNSESGGITVAFSCSIASLGKRLVVVTYGDSWTWGSCADGFPGNTTDDMNSWSTQLKAKVVAAGGELYNLGVGGWNSQEGLDAFGNVLALHPSHCVLNFGINDWGHGPKNELTVAQYHANITSMVNQLKSIGSIPVLWVSGPVSSLTEGNYGWAAPIKDSAAPYRFSEYVHAIQHVAIECQVTLIDCRQAILDYITAGNSIAAWWRDAIHFTQVGHDMIFQTMLPVLAPIMGLPR